MEYSEDFWGAVYYCCDDIAAICRAVGFETPERVDELKSRIAHLEDETFILKTQNEGLEQALDGLRLAGSVTRSSPLSVSNSSPMENPYVQQSLLPEEGGELGEGEGETSEPLYDEGVDLLHADELSVDDQFKFTF